MQRHNLLTDNIFKNSKYMKVFNETFGFKNFRKENRKKYNEYFGQYDLILSIFQTFIKVFNCFVKLIKLKMLEQ